MTLEEVQAAIEKRCPANLRVRVVEKDGVFTALMVNPTAPRENATIRLNDPEEPITNMICARAANMLETAVKAARPN